MTKASEAAKRRALEAMRHVKEMEESPQELARQWLDYATGLVERNEMARAIEEFRSYCVTEEAISRERKMGLQITLEILTHAAERMTETENDV